MDVEGLRRSGEWARPVALAREQLLPVLTPLAPLFPEGGLRRGSTIFVEGPGATSLALALGAATSAAGSWVAAVGLPSLGMLAAAELGVALERVVVVATPPAEAWATVVAALLDAVDLVWAGLPSRVGAGDARRLAARARERGSVLMALASSVAGAGGAGGAGGGGAAGGGSGAAGAAGAGRGAGGDGWLQPVDVRLRTAAAAWAGPAGAGSGRLEARRLEVVVGGRGAAARERRVPLLLPGPAGEVTADPAPAGARSAPAGDLCRVGHPPGGICDKERGGVAPEEEEEEA